MLWNLIAVNYEKYSLHHIVLLISLLLYSYFGAVVFVALEQPYEQEQLRARNAQAVRKSVAAKKELIEHIQKLYFDDRDFSEFYETDLRKAIDNYDISMGQKPELKGKGRWDIWSGLYYSGTIYTTIGYGDLTASTTAGRIFTIIYAILGIPLLITILNDWGTLLFRYVDRLWKFTIIPGFASFKKRIKNFPKRNKNIEEHSDVEEAPLVEPKDPTDSEALNNLPLIVVFIVLIIWLLLSTLVFSFLEGWSFFESLYFYFISMTTIGFGDMTPSHRIAVFNFLPILIGLAVVSMSISVIQAQLEILFAKIIHNIDLEFKVKLISSIDDRKKSIGMTEDLKIEGSHRSQPNKEGDISKQYEQQMHGAERLLMRFMSNHQRKMLNEKFEARQKMRNKWTQTDYMIKTASVQTGYIDMPQNEVEDEEEITKVTGGTKGFRPKRLYIYNTGE